MSDFPNDATPPLYLCNWSRYFACLAATGSVSLNSPATAATVANQIYYMPFAIPFGFNARRAFWANGTIIGNADIAVYTATGTKLWSAGSTAQVGIGAVQFVTVSPALWLPPGRYYLGLVNDSTRWNAATQPSIGQARLAGILAESAFPLPATMASATGAAVVAGYPVCGLTSTDT